MTRCNKCYRLFNHDDDLVKVLIFEEDGKEFGKTYKDCLLTDVQTQEVVYGCPDCLTDAYLTDVEPTHMFCGYCLTKTRHFNNVCGKCGSNNTKIHGFNLNLM